ncbi:MAG: SRPBCC domain-containing protein [Candidatus Devosia phytovorans]|uniref:SRPBCC domain-containing protein n=1 Tax=Candidatus Devosia phytovorans TaxID=3121372 RepID=A0AAJ5VWB9_9HYPH|nr:SRPBCC domain-containing protein [Devosia sp.]WEK04682.1 MAG: SRPBCC domain-containing protein [Devosia sp.]
MGVAVNHRSFVIERLLPGSPSHAFRFWSEFELKRQWISCHPDWTVLEDRFDFSQQGGERTRWLMPDGVEQALLLHYLEIHPAERIVYAYTMQSAGRPISSSLVTVEFTTEAARTRMTYTEQAVFGSVIDGDMRESGTGIGFDRLVTVMEEQAGVGAVP